jgi:hypothetical protein
MQEDVDWADRLASAVLAQMARQNTDREIHSVRAVSATAVEIVFSVPGEGTLRGIRLDLSWVEAASGRIEGSTIEELAFNIVHLGVLEPRSIHEFTVEDTAGVRWLSTENWLED